MVRRGGQLDNAAVVNLLANAPKERVETKSFFVFILVYKWPMFGNCPPTIELPKINSAIYLVPGTELAAKVFSAVNTALWYRKQ